jgi:hypothetical protein
MAPTPLKPPTGTPGTGATGTTGPGAQPEAKRSAIHRAVDFLLHHQAISNPDTAKAAEAHRKALTVELMQPGQQPGMDTGQDPAHP